jgi:hypothetical protein
LSFRKRPSEGSAFIEPLKSLLFENLLLLLTDKNLDLKTLFKGVKVTEEHFEAFYREFSKQLKTMKVGIKIVSSILKKVNLLRDEIISISDEISSEH